MAKPHKPARQRRNVPSDYQLYGKNRQPNELPDFDLGLMEPSANPMCAEVQR